MTIIAFLVGILFPSLNGVLLVRLLEGRTIVLAKVERLALGCVTGLTLMMFLVFVIHVSTGLALALPLFLSVHILCSIILSFFCWKNGFLPSLNTGISFPHETLKDLVTGCFIVLGIWIAAKVLLTSTVFLLLAPTYLDDSLDAWNMRGKLFYTDRALTLVLPGENPETSPLGVSSYPPTVPLVKTWVATLNGEWNNGLINSIQIVWYIAALILVFYGIRRHAGLFWALTGTYLLGSIPLYLMHGTNAYADTFLSVHVFAAVSMLFHALKAVSMDTRQSFLRLGAVLTALLPFTKNEGMLVYLPPLLLLLAGTLFLLEKKKIFSRRDTVQTLLWYGIALLCIAGPWLLFKWSNGLTFGNGKPFTSLGIGWQENVLLSISINTFFEGNWIFLFPLLLGLLIWQWKKAFGPLALLSSYFLIIYIGQGLLYLFTSLSTEALRQTGYARGLIHLTPVVILLTILLLQQAFPRLSNALAEKREMATD